MPATRSTKEITRWGALKTRIPAPIVQEPEEEYEEIVYEDITVPAKILGAPFREVYLPDNANQSTAKTRTLPLDPRPPCLGLNDLEVIRTLGKSLCQVLLVKSKRRVHPLDSGHMLALKAIPRKHCRQHPVEYALELAAYVAEAEGRDEEQNKDYEEMQLMILKQRQKDHLHEKKTEVSILAQLKWNPFVLGLYETFYDSVNLYLGLEYAPGGTLRSLLRKAPGGMKPADAVFYFSNIVCALSFLEENRIVHRDLKPENVLLNADGYLCLTDFGSALSYEEILEHHRDVGGTRGYQAPEWYHLGEYDPEDVRPSSLDWWAAGCMLFEMATGKMAFYEGRVRLAWPPCVRVGAKLQDLIAKFLNFDFPDRIGTEGAHTVQKHPWLTGVNWKRMHERRYLPPYIPKAIDPSGLWHRTALPEDKEVPGLIIKDPSMYLANDDRFPRLLS